MSLFSTSSSQSWRPASDNEAWVGVIFGLTQLDGDLSDSEVQTLSRQFHFNRKFIGVNAADIAEGIAFTGRDIGWPAFVKRCAEAVKPEDAATVFAMACEITLIDGELTSEERPVMEQLVTDLRLDTALAARIVEVYELRMKYQRRS